jgi:hypothetical protein
MVQSNKKRSSYPSEAGTSSRKKQCVWLLLSLSCQLKKKFGRRHEPLLPEEFAHHFSRTLHTFADIKDVVKRGLKVQQLADMSENTLSAESVPARGQVGIIADMPLDNVNIVTSSKNYSK